MGTKTRKLMNRALGSSDLGGAGWSRALRGLRTGEQRDLYIGLVLAAVAFLRRTSPGKTLLYRRKVPIGSAIVIHNRRRGDPKIEVIRPK